MMMITGTSVAKYGHERGPIYLCHTLKNGTFEIQLPLLFPLFVVIRIINQ